KAIAKFDRNPRVRLSSGLMPSDRRCASSRAATSAVDSMGPDTGFLLYHHGRRARETVLFEGDRETEPRGSPPPPSATTRIGFRHARMQHDPRRLGGHSRRIAT